MTLSCLAGTRASSCLSARPVGLLGREQTIGHAFHITSDEVLAWDAIYKGAAHALGVEPQLVHIPSGLIAACDPDALGSLVGDKATSVVFDNSAIIRFVPDFVCATPWGQGARKSIAWFEADKKRQTIEAEANAGEDRVLAGFARVAGIRSTRWCGQ